MKKMRSVMLMLILALITATNSAAQKNEFEVPDYYVFVAKEDYAKYEKEIISAAKWLEETDLNVEERKRKEVGRFLVEWVMGSPTVIMDITKKLSNLSEKNPGLLTIYMGSYSAYCLQHKEDSTKSGPIKAGLNSIMTVYKKDIGIKKNKEMLKLIKLTEAGELDEYIKSWTK